MIGELIAHNSRLQFGGLNHAPYDIINPPLTRHDGRQYPDVTSAFGGMADMAGHTAGHVPVESDPKRTWGAVQNRPRLTKQRTNGLR